MAFDPISLGATLLGGLFGGRSSKGSSQTATKDPWSAAQPYLKENLASNSTLNDFYKQNPFNDIQKQGYQGLLGDTNNLRQNIAPGLMSFANQGMTQSYQRPAYERPGQAGGYGGARPISGGLLSTGQPGPFSVAQQPAFGQIDWNKMNPFYVDPNAPKPAAAAPAMSETEEERRLRLYQEYYNLNLGSSGGGDGGGPGDGGSW